MEKKHTKELEKMGFTQFVFPRSHQKYSDGLNRLQFSRTVKGSFLTIRLVLIENKWILEKINFDTDFSEEIKNKLIHYEELEDMLNFLKKLMNE